MQKTHISLEDDLTGGPAAETVLFGFGGTAYEIDLSAKHADRFRRQLAAFIVHARPVRDQPRRSSPARTAASRERSREIRAWAEEQGFDVAGHGRLPAGVIAEYEQARGGRAPRRGQRG